jgi:dihydroxyacetone kinase
MLLLPRGTRGSDHRPKMPPEIGGIPAKNYGLDVMPAEMAEKQAANRDEARAPGEGVSVEQVTGPAQMIPPPGRQSTHRRPRQ